MSNPESFQKEQQLAKEENIFEVSKPDGRHYGQLLDHLLDQLLDPGVAKDVFDSAPATQPIFPKRGRSSGRKKCV